jgi:hypothetical protein
LIAERRAPAGLDGATPENDATFAKPVSAPAWKCWAQTALVLEELGSGWTARTLEEQSGLRGGAMSKISTGIQINPSTGAPVPRTDWALDADALTRMDLKLTSKAATKEVDLAPSGKRIDFLYVSAVSGDEKTTVEGTLIEAGKPNNNVAFSLAGFPLVLGGDTVKLLGDRRQLKFTLGGDKKDTDVVVLIGREG